MSIKIYKPGITVFLGNSVKPIEATINSVKLTGSDPDSLNVTYEVFWWENSTRSAAWITENEIRINKDPTMEIGFK